MSAMTSHERFTRMYEHKEADRIPIIDGPWSTTIERWQREGMPEDMNFVDFFDLDHVGGVKIDNSPRYEEKTIEETEEYSVFFNKWGCTSRRWKHAVSTPEFLDFTIKDPEIWKEEKKRVTPTRDRIDWEHLKNNYDGWCEKGFWKQAGLHFGFDISHSHIVGTERFLMALITDPDWCVDLFNHFLDVDLTLLDMVWDEGYTFDAITWCDDMGYKLHQFFSVQTYRDLLKPAHKRAIDWAHKKGIKARLHSCGDIRPLIPDLIEIGLDCLNPLEVKAGMDPIWIKNEYGKDLVLHGGINAVHWDNLEKIQEEMKKVVPVLKESGGYIFSSDHSVPDTTSLENFRHITNLAKELGSY